MFKNQTAPSKITSNNTQNATFDKLERCQAAAIRFVDSENQANVAIESNNPSFISSHFWNGFLKSWYDAKTNSCYLMEISAVENKKGSTTTLYNSLTGEELAWWSFDDATPPNNTYYVGYNQTTFTGFEKYEKSLGMPFGY